jgi:uncharacterized repeat protein (TIGR04138 family)
MPEPREFLDQIEAIAETRGSFRPDAYRFVLEALERAMAGRGEPAHVSGQFLLESLKDLGRERFGIMAAEVFAAWGVRSTLDFGRCVFHLVDAGVLDKRDEDSLADFIDKFDFRQAFEEDYFLGKA